jgi:hypothetical protein
MHEKGRTSESEIIVKVPVESAIDRKRVAAMLVALLDRIGIPAKVILPEDDDPSDPSDDGKSEHGASN